MDNMARFIIVDGVQREMTPTEEAARAAEEAAYVPPVPHEATVLQLYDEMYQVHGIDLEDAVAGRSPKAAKRFRLANTIRRSDPMVADLQANLGWTDAQVDALFRAAAARGA